MIQLQRRAVLRTEADGQRRAVHPKGVLLRTDPRQTPDAEAPVRIEEEEVPREGVIVERAFQFARWFDGRAVLWLGRRKGAGRGEGASGLRFDVIDRLASGPPHGASAPPPRAARTTWMRRGRWRPQRPSDRGRPAA